MQTAKDHGHRKSELRNLALHRAALAKLREDPALQARCLALVERWLGLPDQGSARWLLQWRDMLQAWSLDRIAETVLDDELGQTLRQCSPLGPALTPAERWAVLRQLREENAAS